MTQDPKDRLIRATVNNLNAAKIAKELSKKIASKVKRSANANNESIEEATWWWLTDTKPGKNGHWADVWLENNPSDRVGTKNESNRRKWLKKTLSSLPKNSRILDAGAGELQYKNLCKHLDYVSQDFGMYSGDGKEGLQMGTWDNSHLDIVSDITEIPVPNNSFDAIMCTEVLEHLPKPIDAIKEFSRIIRKGGTLIITAPFASMTHFAPYYFYNGYSKFFYEKILAEYGFEITEIDYNGNYFEFLAQEINRLESVEKMYVNNQRKMTNIEKLSVRVLLRRLASLTKKDTKSHELLCHGLHIKAVKK